MAFADDVAWVNRGIPPFGNGKVLPLSSIQIEQQRREKNGRVLALGN